MKNAHTDSFYLFLSSQHLIVAALRLSAALQSIENVREEQVQCGAEYKNLAPCLLPSCQRFL